MIEVTRNEMEKTGLPGVIENVPQAPIKRDIILRGDMFGLKVLRVRHFELVNWWAMCPMMPNKIGSVKMGDYCSVFGKGSYTKSKFDLMPKFKKEIVVKTWNYAMGIDWMKKEKELSNSIPPAYTRYIGQYFLNS
jgi:DNA (cytosine-5)-methyltransferase 1